MTISFICPHCNTQTEVDEQYAGQSGPCRSCGQKVTIPVPPGVAAAPATKSSGATVLMAIVLISLMGLFLCGGGMVALLLPAVQASREAARRANCSNNLKQIALAMHNYHDVYQSFPPAYTVDENGKPLHSWRTLLLPFLEQQAIYQQIDLNEPWDSPKNKPFNSVFIPTYHCPGNSSTTDCSYVAVIGKNTVFQGPTPVKITDIVDGSSQTIMIVEMPSNPRNWMEPVDLDAAKMTSSINGGPNEPGSFHPGGMNVSMADGSVQFISQTVDKRSFEAMLTIDGKPLAPLP